MQAGTTASIECNGLKSPQTQHESVWCFHFIYFSGNCCTGAHFVGLHTTIASSDSSKPVRLTKADALRQHQEKPDTTYHTKHNLKSQVTCLTWDLWCYVIRALTCAVPDRKKTRLFCNIRIHALILNYLFTGLGRPPQLLQTLKQKSACQTHKWQENISAKI